MQVIIDFFTFVSSKLVNILDSLKIGNSPSFLMYLLGAIIITFIFRIIRGGSSEFEQNTNFMNGRIINNGLAKYKQGHSERKAQLVSADKKLQNDNMVYGEMSYLSEDLVYKEMSK